MTALYLTHGGGPLPLLNDATHQELITFLQIIPEKINTPKAILMISAHWEQTTPTLTSGDHPELIYDYGGFPPESYEIQYPALGSPELAGQVQDLLNENGFDASLDDNRGFDHGMFVPLKLMYPDANIPVVQLSLLASLDPEAHLKLGQALAPLHKENILIIGSGSSFHNMRALIKGGEGKKESSEFNSWLIETSASKSLSKEDRIERLINWQQSPHGRYCHPREEHLLPLHVCLGAALGEAGKTVFNGKIMGIEMAGFLWS